MNGIVTLFESRGDVVGVFTPNNVFTPPLTKAIAQMKLGGKICAYGFDLPPSQLESIKAGDLTGSLGSSRSCKASGRSCSSICRSTEAFRPPTSTRARNS